MFIIEAAKRLRAMSEKRKDAMFKLGISRTRYMLVKHFILIKMFPDAQEVPHWQKECRTLLEQTLDLTYLKGNKVLPLSDYLKCVWEGPAEPDDCRIRASQALADEGWQDKRPLLKSIDYEVLSHEYKAWLTKWYTVYNDPHSEYRELPQSIF